MTRDRISLFALIAAAASGLLAMIGKCVSDPDGDEFPKIDPRVSMSVALITVDDLPAERLHLYNPSAPVQAAVDELARVGITCHFSFAAAETEPAAAASILTGQLPSTHRVLSAGDRLAPSELTLAKLLSARGFATAAFSNVPLLGSCGLDRGFAAAEEHRDAGSVELAALAGRWLETVGDRNFLLWVHCAPVRDLANGRDADPARAFDQLVGGVSAALRSVRMYEGTVIVAAGAHDAAAVEPNEVTDFVVPLIFKLPKRQPMGAIRTGPCSLLDVTPTILDLLGMEAVAGFPSRSLCQGPGGNNPLLSGFHFNERAFFERFLPGDRNPILCLRNQRYEIDRGPKPAQFAVYDRHNDKKGSRNLVLEPDEPSKRVVDAMIKDLFEREARLPRH